MSLKKIENQLKRIGYICNFNKIVDSLLCSIGNSSSPEDIVVGSNSRIRFENDNYILYYFDRNIDIKEYYDSEIDLINRIKILFPIEN